MLTRPPAETGADTPIPLGNIDGKTLKKVVDYCQYHYEHSRNVQVHSRPGGFSRHILAGFWPRAVSGRLYW